MKNCFIQIQELRVAEARLETLEDRKKRLEERIKSCTSELKDVVSSTTMNDDKLANYLISLQELEEEISYITEDIKCLKHNLAIMEEALNEIKDIKYEIFLLKYKDNKKVKEIAKIKHFTPQRIYQHLDEINIIINSKHKD